VKLDMQQLAAFAAVIEEGSFDAAARRLQITPSAVSQRIKALEEGVGQVLVKRQKPAVPTASAQPLVRVAAQMALLEAEAIDQLRGADHGVTRISLAVNADSMATWFGGVFAGIDDVLFDVRIEDQDHSARLLREGAVMGAVTTERTPVPGCRVEALGVMRYLPVATGAYMTRYMPDGFTKEAAAQAPSLAWNRDDALQDMLVRKTFRRAVGRPTHYVPTTEGFAAAIRAGLGWGMYPEQSAAAQLTDGSITPICDVHLDVPLFWQSWKLESPMIRAITDAVRTAAVDLHRRRK
jgi:LysR family transcriptional regulator (chromosome initiation inhibitor)